MQKSDFHRGDKFSQWESGSSGDRTEKWTEVLIHGDPKALKSLAEQLIYLAELNQEKVPDCLLPTGAREHIHLRPNLELSKNSLTTIIGRLDSKGTKEFHDKFIPNERK